MKKITSKLTRKKDVKKPARITNETVAEHREQILAEARRFKYPVQYTKYRLIISAVIIGVVALLLFVLFSWWQLYKVQSTSEFFYRITRLVPVPVAQVDGENVKYGDYLLHYKGSETYFNTIEKSYREGTPEGTKAQFDYFKADAMNNAIIDTYAAKVARENNITVSPEKVDATIKRQRQTTRPEGEVSMDAYNRSARQLYGWSPEENRYILERSILRQEVSYLIDEHAKEVADAVSGRIAKAKGEADFEKIAKSIKQTYPEVEVLTSGWVKKSNPDGGIAAAAAKLKKGATAGPIKPFKGDGYYFVKLLDHNKDGDISYGQIKVPLHEFNKRITDLRANGGIKHYIAVPDVRPQIDSKK